MYINNLNPIFINFGLFEIRWYSLAYIFGILAGWYLGKKICLFRNQYNNSNLKTKDFDDLISYVILSIIIGGRLGYIIFYNLKYYLNNFFDIFKIWEGGMSFHGALIGVITCTYFFAKSRNIKKFLIFDALACVTPIGLFFGRVANFINSELVGTPSNLYWSVIFTLVDNIPRHPSQIYEALLEGLFLFAILSYLIFFKRVAVGICSSYFLILYGIFRIFSEQFREPDPQVGYLFGLLSMGSFLSLFMILVGLFIFLKIKKDDSN